jgi:hypothetical protein
MLNAKRYPMMPVATRRYITLLYANAMLLLAKLLDATLRYSTLPDSTLLFEPNKPQKYSTFLYRHLGFGRSTAAKN